MIFVAVEEISVYRQANGDLMVIRCEKIKKVILIPFHGENIGRPPSGTTFLTLLRIFVLE
jgi:hypothetical protein